MSVPGPLPPGGSGHGPFGLRAFRVALAGCVVAVVGLVGVEASQRDLEDIAPPLSVQEAELEEPGEEADPYGPA